MVAHGAVRSNIGVVVRKFTPTLWLACITTALLNVLFGYDTTSFGGVQAIPAFTRQFGTPIGPGGTYMLSASRASFMSSVAFAGKFLGTLSSPFLIELIGHKFSIWATCAVSFIGIIVECSSATVAQFVVGRCIVYFSVGMAEVCVTTYQAEIVPAAARGAIVGTIQLFNQIGQIVAAGVNRSFYLSTEAEGWIVPVACSAVAPFILTIGTFFIPDGPRWLISKKRKDKAVKVLEKVRDKEDVKAGHCQAEADAIEEALNNKVEKGPWLDLFRGNNRRRTAIAAMIYIFQQLTGQGFVTQYSPRFYETVGLSAYAFDYNIGSASCGWAGCLIGTFTIDYIGRRPMLLIGAAGQAIFLFIIAGIGLDSNPTSAASNMLVASVMLFLFFYFGFWAAPSYVIGGEIGTAALREKTQAFTISLNVISAWLVAFVVPYLLDDIGANIGWVFGSIATIAVIWTFFFCPELQNRSLEEIDELFERNIPARKFAQTETFGAGRRVAEIENLSAGQVEGVLRKMGNADTSGDGRVEVGEDKKGVDENFTEVS